MQLPVFRAFWGTMTGWVRRVPHSLIRVLAATTVVTGMVLGIAVMVTLAVQAGMTVFAGVFSSPSIAVMAFQPYADGPVHIDADEAAQARRDILADSGNPLRCVASADMKSGARAVMVFVDASDPGAASGGGPAGAEPIQVTDSTAALLPQIEQVIATIPTGAEFFEAYAFVVTALNGGVDSWERFVSVTTQMYLGTPKDSAAAMETAKVFFTPDSDFSVTEALSAAVMLRLASNRMVSGEQYAGALLEAAVNRCTNE